MAKLTIELIYALVNEQILLTQQVDEPCTLHSAIIQSGILQRYPEIDLKKNKIGIFSQVTDLNETLRDGDRIEIYRSLVADPKEARKKKAVLQKKKKD